MRIFIAGYLVAAVSALPRQPRSEPTVTIRNGTIIGATLGDVETFRGIPFALPPLGPWRLKPPQPLDANFGTFNATDIPAACPTVIQGQNPLAFAFGVPTEELLEIATLLPSVYYTSENCLTLDVQRPARTRAGDKLPVLFWIYGGGFESGATQIYNFDNIVTYAKQLNHPMIVVQANYRQGVFGFTAGEEAAKEGATNLGLKDQRLAMRWVAENIEAFGGDPDKVVIWGESAGAVSVVYHTMINGGDHRYRGKPLFRGAMMNSGATQPAYPADSPVAEKAFQSFVQKTRCSDSRYPLDCLRRLPYDELAWTSAFIPALVNLQGLAFSVTPRPSPDDPFFNTSAEEALGASPPRIAPVPIINGIQEDEGTFFAVGFVGGGTETQPGFVDALQNLYPYTPRSVLEKIVSMYPEDPAAGSPFNTGNTNEIYPGFKRNSAVLGDLIFNFQRKAYLAAAAKSVKAWSFTASYRKFPVLGTFHGSDLLMLVEKWPTSSYLHMWQYYVSFVHYLDPNVLSRLNGTSNTTEWPTWDNEKKLMLDFGLPGEKVIEDTARDNIYQYYRSRWSDFRI